MIIRWGHALLSSRACNFVIWDINIGFGWESLEGSGTGAGIKGVNSQDMWHKAEKIFGIKCGSLSLLNGWLINYMCMFWGIFSPQRMVLRNLQRGLHISDILSISSSWGYSREVSGWKTGKMGKGPMEARIFEGVAIWYPSTLAGAVIEGNMWPQVLSLPCCDMYTDSIFETFKTIWHLFPLDQLAKSKEDVCHSWLISLLNVEEAWFCRWS